tara:strand:- start:343 stop:735 length:393 start_codon:yes stop_codon:yes gene_type:complete
MAFIKHKNKDPKRTDFSKKELVINTKEGSLFFKSNKGLHKTVTSNNKITFTQSGSINISGSIIPNGSGSHDLGSTTNPWRDLHIMSSSIKFYNNNGEIGHVSYVEDEGLRISDESDNLQEIIGVINGGSF